MTCVGVPTRGQETAEDQEFLRGVADVLARGDLSSFVQDLEEFVQDVPGSLTGWMLLAEVEWKRGDAEAARDSLEEARPLAEKQGRLPEWGQLTWAVEREAGRLEEAEQALHEGLALSPADPRLLSRLVQHLEETGRREEARARLTELPAVKVGREGDPGLLLEHARALLAVNDLSQANRCAVFAEYQWRRSEDPRQADALMLLADTYRRGRTEDGLESLRAYRAALEINSSLAECHVGIARTYLYRMDFDQAEEAVEQALALRPELPDALAVKAEVLLFDRKFSEGIALADRGLRRNPRHRPLLASRAAGHVLLGTPEAADTVQALEQVDDYSADGFRVVGDLVSYHYRFHEAIPYYERGIQRDPEWATNYVGLARCLANTGQIDLAEAALTAFRKYDKLRYPLAHNLSEAMGAVRELEEIPFDHLRFQMHPLDQAVLLPILGPTLSHAWDTFRERYQVTDRPVRIEVFPDQDDFSARSVGFAGFGALGVCFGNTVTMISPRSQMRGAFHFERTAVHELTHVVSLALSNQRVPRWLTEGMSVYEEHVYQSYCDREMDLELFQYYHSGELVPVLELNRLFGGPRILFGYYQGGLICEYLVERFGPSVLVQMLALYGEDRETPEVIRTACQISPGELDRDFQQWLWDTRLSHMKVQPTYTSLGRARLLDQLAETGDPDVALLTQIAWAYHRADRKVDRNDFLARARRVDPEHPPLLFLLADLARERGDAEAERDALERAFERGGMEWTACLRRAELAVRDDDLDEALVWYAKARDCFPRYVGPGNPYVLRGRILLERGDEEEALVEYRRYCAIHETDSAVRVELVQRALAREDWAEAALYLRELRSIDPFQRALHRDLARCQKELGETSAALASLRMALAVDPSTEPTYDPDLPEEERALADRKERAEIHRDLSELYRDLGEDTLARQEQERAQALDPDSDR